MTTNTVRYLAFVLDGDSVSSLIQYWRPAYRDVKCHHVTLIPNMEKEIDNTGALVWLERLSDPYFQVAVRGRAQSEKTDAVLVAIGNQHIRFDGVPYHITLSVNEGGKTKDSCSFEEKDYELNRGIFLVKGSLAILYRNKDESE